jgi:hypothetical protein
MLRDEMRLLRWGVGGGGLGIRDAGGLRDGGVGYRGLMGGVGIGLVGRSGDLGLGWWGRGGLGMGEMGMRGLRDGNCTRRKERL